MKQSKLMMFMPEMRIFWFFILLLLGVLGTTFFELSPVLKIVSFVILTGIGFIVYVNTTQITRKNLETKTAYARLQNVISNLRDGVIVYDQNFKIYIFNSAAENILSLKAEEIIGQTFTLKLKEGMQPKYRLLLMLLFPALAPTVIRRTEAGAYPQITDFSFDNPQLDLRVTTTEVRDEDGYAVGYMKVVRDRTRELALLRAKNEFITIASHQLRTPLTGISWAWETLHGETLTSEQKEVVENGREATSYLLKIIEDLLQTAQIEEGRFGYQFTEVDMKKFAEEIVGEYMPVAKEKQVSLYLDAPKESVTLMADADKLRIALSNLVDNGIKYNIPGGEVTVTIELPTKEPFVKVSVKDTGLGIAEETLPQLFKKFFRGEEVKQREVNGSGLGLYIVKNIIRRHGGKIWAESTPNRGSIFSFTLPTDPSLIPPKEIVYEEE